jgi:3-oxoacyl-[acyl-carrier-protein] synthase-1
MSVPVGIVSTGLVTPVGLSAPAACAAIRAKISNPTETRCIDSTGEWIVAHQVPLAEPLRGLSRLTRMAALALRECLEGASREECASLPLLLCVAEPERPGRTRGLDERLFSDIERELEVTFAPGSAIVTQGRVGAAVALTVASRLIYEKGVPRVVIASADSLISQETLDHYESGDRLLTSDNSNGFIPGEGASAMLVARPTGRPQLVCAGVGLASEEAHIESDRPLRADGLTAAHRAALAQAGCSIDELGFRITDLSGEQYYFKEASLASSRLLSRRREEPQVWHPAECTGQAGAALGGIAFAVAHAALVKGYAPTEGVLLHFSEDSGQRCSVVGVRG